MEAAGRAARLNLARLRRTPGAGDRGFSVSDQHIYCLRPRISKIW